MSGRVLVVDDVERNVKLLEAKLEGEYYEVVPAYSGKEALEKLKTISPDLILLDVMMPGMDGVEVCKKIKHDPETQHIPVVMVTALNEQEDRVRGLKAGATDFITKPIDELHLFARVKSLVRSKTMLDALIVRDKTYSKLGFSNNLNSYEIDYKGSKVMLIDDDVIQVKNIKKCLEEYSYEIDLYDFAQGIEQLDKKDYDLFIISTILDELDGIRLGMQIRSNTKFRSIPVVLMVDEDDRDLLIKGLRLGLDDYISTPIDYNELIARVRTQLKNHKYHSLLKDNYRKTLSDAVIDSLTKLYNRRFLDEHFGNIVQTSINQDNPLCFCMIDIDFFKNINDKPGWGHHIGDEILRQIGDEILDSVRSTDLVARYGGEEFVVIMPHTDLRDAKNIAERVRKNVEKKDFQISAEPYIASCTVSIGVSNLQSSEDDADSIKNRADKALYSAKNSGRNLVITV